MILFWRIRYLDTRDKEFRDRDLWLDTEILDPLTKAAAETTYALKNSDPRSILKYRHLFTEVRPNKSSMAFSGGFCLSDYFEDEDGQELSYKRMAVVLTDNPDAVYFPPGTRPHDAEYCLAEKPTIDLQEMSLSQTQLDVLGYFTRDLRELLVSAMYRDGPGSLSGPWSDGRLHLETAVSDEEIRSFVTIFRRLYMEKEPANFCKAVNVFVSLLPAHPISNWVRAIATEFESSLARPPESVPMLGPHTLPFSRKRLIDVYLYTQYAHQPDDRRARQFKECLSAVENNRSSLTWLFLTEMWKCAIEMRNAGVIIAEFYDRYCKCHGTDPGVLASVRSDHQGLGTLEKKDAQEARVIREKAEKLAVAMWEKAGRPEGGHTPFIQVAMEQLKTATGRM